MNKDKKAVLDRVRQSITPEQRELVKMNLHIACQISILLKKQGLTQKDFAQILGKAENEVSRLLSGRHNFSLKTLAGIQAALVEKY